jgi:hypothetical protein
MASAKRRYPKEEFARRGDEIYERDIRRTLQPKDEGKFVAIDIETGEYEMDNDELAACDRLYARIPSAQPWLTKVGSRAAHHFGAVPRRKIR